MYKRLNKIPSKSGEEFVSEVSPKVIELLVTCEGKQ